MIPAAAVALVPGLPGAPLGLPGAGLGPPLGGVGGAFTKGAVGSVLNGVVAYLAAGATAVLAPVQRLLSGTAPRLAGSWVGGHLGVMIILAGTLIAPMLAAATIGAVVRQDMARLARTWGVFLPVATVGAGLVIPLTSEGLAVTDAMSSAIGSHLGVSLAAALLSLGSTVEASAATTGGGVLVGGLLALLVVTGGFLLWLELLLRTAAIDFAVFFMPLALAGLVWPATVHWARRCLHLLVALLLSKFVIVVALVVGAGALSSVGPHPLDHALMGSAVLALAAFAPFVLLRMAPVIEAAAISHLEGTSRRPLHAARAAVAAADVGGRHPVVSALAGAWSNKTGPPAETSVAMRDLARLGNELELGAEHGGGRPDAAGASRQPGSDGADPPGVDVGRHR
jgi:hypothetical protein